MIYFYFFLTETGYSNSTPNQDRPSHKRRSVILALPARTATPTRRYSVVPGEDVALPTHLLWRHPAGHYYTFLLPYSLLEDRDGFIYAMVDHAGIVRGIFSEPFRRVRINRNNMSDIQIMTPQENGIHDVNYLFEPAIASATNSISRN